MCQRYDVPAKIGIGKFLGVNAYILFMFCALTAGAKKAQLLAAAAIIDDEST